MPALILYLLKVNVALVLFYLAYHVALRRLTFYHLNRLFLIFGIVFSSVYPFIDVSELFAENENITKTYMATIPAWVITAQTAAPAPETFDLWQLPVYLFWAGVVVMLVRFILQFVSLYKIHANSEPAQYKSIRFREIKSISQAFSFWQTIYINPAKHKSEELESILRHELIHITGWHTLDVMLAELSTVIYWFNPGAWLMKKAVKENLEFIADQNVVNTGVDKKEYQYLLLKVVGATQPQIANQFNFPSLKRRIAMMNKKQTSLTHIIRYVVLIPLIAAPTIMLSAKSKATETAVLHIPKEQTEPKKALPDSVIYFIDGKEVSADAYKNLDPKEINSVNVLKGEHAQKVFGKKASKGAISIITEKNKNSKQVQDFHKRFPAPPTPGTPPTPPVPAEPGTPPPPAAAEPAPPAPPAPPVNEKLPPPPPPVRHNEPLISGTGAKLVEDERTITYVLWPGETTKREFEVAKNAFKESGFDLSFDQKYEGDKLVGIKITLKSDRKGSNANAVYNTHDLDGLKASDNVIVVKANKKTGELIVGSTIAKK